MSNWLASWLFSPTCPGCGASAAGFCPPCEVALCANLVACPGCAEPLDAAEPARCRRCVARPLPLARIVAPWLYGGSLAAAVARWKYARRAELARPLAPLVAPVLAAVLEATGATHVVPVPLHWTRRFARGFDQSRLLLAHALPAPSIAAALVRTRATPPQSRLGAAERARNLTGAIAVRARYRSAVRGAVVVLFDDVVTTGATMAAAAGALLDAGAREVSGVALARASAGVVPNRPVGRWG